MIDYSFRTMRMWSMLGSCGAFGMAALELPEIDDRVVMLTSDLTTFSGLERFKAKYTDRLYNFGIAEQNMVGAAAGFAKEGFIPFATTYATFASMRVADQVKVNMGYMCHPIKLVGLTSGFSVGVLGATHMSLEDIAVMRSIPNVTVLSPADCTSVVKATIAAVHHPGPVYLRLSGGMNNPMVYKDDFDFQIGKAIKLRDGDDIAVLATGSMVHYAQKAAEKLSERGVSVSVYDFPTIKPLDRDALRAVSGARLLVTVEEHSRIGGFGSAVAEAFALERKKPPHLILGTDDRYLHAGRYEDLLAGSGLSVEGIATNIYNAYQEVNT